MLKWHESIEACFLPQHNAIKRQLQPISCNQNFFFPLRIFLQFWVNIFLCYFAPVYRIMRKKAWIVRRKLKIARYKFTVVRCTIKVKMLQLPFNNLFMLCIYFFHSGNKLPYETINDERIVRSFLLKKKIYIYCEETLYMSMHSSLLDMNMRSINTEFKNKFSN